MTLAADPLCSARRKHIEVRFHFVREIHGAHKIDNQFVASEEQQAEILAKPLPATPVKYHRRLLFYPRVNMNTVFT